MIVKQVKSEELLTLAEVKEILLQIAEEREKGGKELRYEQKRALEHVKTFVKLTAKDAKKMVEELLKLEKMKPSIAIQISNILPVTKDEVRSIYAKERFTLTEEDLEKILDIVKKYAYSER